MYYNDKTIVFLNGKFIRAVDAHAGLFNQTMHYGNGVFEGIRSYKTSTGTQVFKSREHFERLLYSAEKMHIKMKYSVNELTDITYEVLEKNNFSDAYIRPLVYLGENMQLGPVNDVNVFVAAWEWANYLGDKLTRVMLSSYQRPNPKSCHVEAKVVGHYVNSILATTEAKSKGYDEALLLDMNGHVAEASGANFFYEKNGKLFTAPKGNILMGITRATVLEIAKEEGIEVEESFFTPEMLKDADSAFFSGTAAEVAGIESINDRLFRLKWENSLGRRIQVIYKNLVTGKQEKKMKAV
ncbi:MAG: branched-chain amino acid transaminase [Bacteroidetes bacterium]|nr:branched-chain amino acid transaminase [Bacteroidota bacterium]